MRRGCGGAGDARRESGRGPEHFDVDPGPGNAPCRQASLEILEKAGRSAQVEISILGNPDLVEQLGREMAQSIEVLAEHVSWCRPTVDHAAMRRPQRNEQIVRLLGKRMVRPIAGRMQPPNRPRRHGACSGRTMQHRQHRRDADTGADEDDRRCTGRERERTARSADLQPTACPDALVEKAACDAAFVLDANPIVGGPGRAAQRIVPGDGGSIRARLHADHDVLARQRRWQRRTVFGGELERSDVRAFLARSHDHNRAEATPRKRRRRAGPEARVAGCASRFGSGEQHLHRALPVRAERRNSDCAA